MTNAKDVIAERRFELPSGEFAKLSISRPSCDGVGFRCEGAITLDGAEHTFVGVGTDSIQALLNALIQADWAMETHGLRALGASWVGQKRDGDWGLLRTDFDRSNNDAVHLIL